jgi:monovalent cation:H+ antiporter, CPA1 family
MSFETTFVALFTVATVVALLARWLKLPYTVALVLAGLGLGATRVLHPPTLSKDLLYAVFLPGLLFESSFALRFQRFWAERGVILALALPGVVAVMVCTSLLLLEPMRALGLATSFSFAHGLAFGVVIAATDPIAVVAIFKRLAVVERLRVIVEGESLLNDGVTVVLFALVVSAISGEHASTLAIGVSFVRIVGLGILVGVVVAFVAARLIARTNEAMVEVMVTTVAAYASFVLAEQVHSSGVLATVIAGMLCGDAARRSGLSAEGRVAVHVTWEYIAFALNSVLFLLIGFQVQVHELLASWKAILVAFAAVTLGRVLVVLVVTALFSRSKKRLPFRWSLPLAWGGLRGGLSMVLVLGLPDGFPHRALLVSMTFGVVFISIVLQGTTMSVLLDRLGMSSPASSSPDVDAKLLE